MELKQKNTCVSRYCIVSIMYNALGSGQDKFQKSSFESTEIFQLRCRENKRADCWILLFVLLNECRGRFQIERHFYLLVFGSAQVAHYKINPFLHIASLACSEGLEYPIRIFCSDLHKKIIECVFIGHTLFPTIDTVGKHLVDRIL